MRTEDFKRGVVSTLLVFALLFSMISVTPLASSGDLIYDPGGEIIEVVQGDNFLLRHTLEWSEPENGAYAITMAWDCYDNEPSQNFTFVEASAYFTTGDYVGEPILADVTLGSVSSPDYPGSTRNILKVECPAKNKDSRNGQFNVDITLGAYGAGGVPHIPGDHVIPFQFAGIIIVEKYPLAWNRDPITIRVLAKLISISPNYQSGLPGTTLEYIVTVTNVGENEDNFDLTVSDSENWGPTLDDYRFENIPPGKNRITTLRVTVPLGAIIGTKDRITVTTISQSDPNVRDNVVVEAIAQMPGIVCGKDTAYNVNNRPPPPWKTYEMGDLPPLMVAKRVGSGAAIAAGFAPACRDGHWNIPGNPDNHLPELLHASFQWMVPGATKVLWYEGYGVYNNRGVCATLVEALTNLGYTITGSTSPFTSSLLAPYDIVVIPQMQLPYPPSADYPSGNPNLLPDADVQAIKNWVEGGGGLLIMEATDFFDYKYPEVQNKVLLALGFDYLFQDDSVYDDTNNIAGANYRAIVDVDDTTEIGEVYQSLTGKTTIGLYGYCSLAKVGPGVSVKVVSDYQVGMPGTTLEYDVVVFNPYNPAAVDLTYDILVSENADWSPSVSPTSLSVPIGEKKKAILSVTVPAGTPLSTEDEILVEAVAVGYPEVRDSFTCRAHAGLSIKPTMDAYVSDEENDKAYGADDPLPLYTGRYGEYWQNTYLQFDLPYTIPSEASITDARLYLFCYFVYGTQEPIACTEVDDDEWDELTITWNNKPESGAVLDQRLVHIGESDFPISYSWDATSFVDQEFKEDKVVSLCLGGLEDHPVSVNESFLSKDWPYEDRVHPFLRISYTTVVVERKVSVSISPYTKSGSPGETLTFTVTVTNEGTLDDSYSLTVTDTAGWSPIISPSTLTLDAGTSGTATLAVTIPSDAAEGDSTTITVTATSQADSAVSDSASCVARVLGIPDIWVEPTSFDVTLLPDTSENYVLTIGNDGNALLTYNLSDVETTTEAVERKISTQKVTLPTEGPFSKSEGIVRYTINVSDIEPTGNWQLLLTDPDEPEIWMDLEEVYAKDDGSNVYFKVVFYEAWPGDPHGYIDTAIFLDIDQNQGTGLSNAQGWYEMNDIGADYAAVVGREGDSVWKWDEASEGWNLSWAPFTYLELDPYTNVFEVGISLDNIGNPDAMDLIVGNIDVASEWGWDYAPTEGDGHVTYNVGPPWLDENPKSGTVEPGSFDEITISIDTTGLDLGDYSANIVIHNNDPDEDPKVVPVYLTVSVVPREWDASITATFSGGSDNAIFGVRPDATSGFDYAYDIPEPPAPPKPPHMRAYFYYPEQTPGKLHRSCLAPENLMEWPLRIEYADNIENVTLTWSVENIPTEYNVLLFRGGDLVADMRVEDSYTFEATTGSYDFRIVVGKLLPFTLELAEGWNMISFPLLPENTSPDSIFSSYYVLYGWDAENKCYVLHADSGSFIEPDLDVEVGVGYWVYVLEDENVDLLGVPVSQLTLSLYQGWNLIGPPYGGSSLADPADDPDNSVITWAFTWDAGERSYRMTQQLEAGKGYWINALRNCTLELP